MNIDPQINITNPINVAGVLYCRYRLAEHISSIFISKTIKREVGTTIDIDTFFVKPIKYD